MLFSRSNAYDNSSKKEARELLCAHAEYHFKNLQQIKMLELLGEGVGVYYYLEKIKNLEVIHAIETDKRLINSFNDNIIKDNLSVKLFNTSLFQFLHSNSNGINTKYDIVNLDFCGFYVETPYLGKQESAGQNLNAVFNNKPFNVGSLILVTFLLQGGQLNMNPFYKNVALRNKEDVCRSIINIANNNNVIIDLASPSSVILYKPSKATTMMNACFVVKSMQ